MVRGKEAGYTTKYLMPSLHHAGHWAYKIPDDITGMTGKRPFDIVGVATSGRGLAIEVKQMTKYESFGIFTKRWLADHQIAALERIDANGGAALVALFVHAYGELRLYVWTISQLREFGRNLTKKEMLEYPYLKTQRVTNGEGVTKRVFDLSPWL